MPDVIPVRDDQRLKQCTQDDLLPLHGERVESTKLEAWSVHRSDRNARCEALRLKERTEDALVTAARNEGVALTKQDEVRRNENGNHAVLLEEVTNPNAKPKTPTSEQPVKAEEVGVLQITFPVPVIRVLGRT